MQLENTETHTKTFCKYHAANACCVSQILLGNSMNDKFILKLEARKKLPHLLALFSVKKNLKTHHFFLFSVWITATNLSLL